MVCEWNPKLDGFKDPFKVQEGDCVAPATITIGRHPWAFVCEVCVKSPKLKTFVKRSIRQDEEGGKASVKGELYDKCETAGTTMITRQIIRRKKEVN